MAFAVVAGFSTSDLGSAALSEAGVVADGVSSLATAAAEDEIDAAVGRDLPRKLNVGRGRVARCVVVL